MTTVKRMRLLAGFLAVVGSIWNTTSAEEIAKWEFDSEPIGWQPNDQAQLSLEDGHLRIVSTGNDPFLTIPVDGRAGQHQITIRAKMAGRTPMQVFWTTEAAPGTAEERSIKGELSGSANEFRTLKLWFSTDSPVTSLRLDPMSKAGEMLVESIVLSDEAPPVPEATPVADMKFLEGFHIELLYSVPGDTMGSWVSMTTDPKGRLIVSDQYGKLYRITPPPVGTTGEISIEPVDLEIGMAQGLLYAFDSLYVMVNGSDAAKQGLYRVRDTDNNDQFDQVEHLRHLDGGGEHGPHAIVLSRTVSHLLSVRAITPSQQNSVHRAFLETGAKISCCHECGMRGACGRYPGPRRLDCQSRSDGKNWELLASGFRNQYDIAYSPDGELFTYDADMEWDVGTPWYRPTRVNHVTSGAEFGWRSGTGKWPVWYPTVLDPSWISVQALPRALRLERPEVPSQVPEVPVYL